MRAKRVVLIGTRSADFIMARGHRAAPFEAEHMTAPDHIAARPIFLLRNSGRPHMMKLASRARFLGTMVNCIPFLDDHDICHRRLIL